MLPQRTEIEIQMAWRNHIAVAAAANAAELPLPPVPPVYGSLPPTEPLQPEPRREAPRGAAGRGLPTYGHPPKETPAASTGGAGLREPLRLLPQAAAPPPSTMMPPPPPRSVPALPVQQPATGPAPTVLRGAAVVEVSDSSDEDDEDGGGGGGAFTYDFTGGGRFGASASAPAGAAEGAAEFMSPPDTEPAEQRPLRPGEAFTIVADGAIIRAVTSNGGVAQAARDALVADGVLDDAFGAQMVLDRFTDLCEKAAMESAMEDGEAL